MQAAIIAIGNELLSGLFPETNSQYLITELKQIGIRVSSISIVNDEISSILYELDSVHTDVRYVFITGGLGATHDDVTKAAAVKYFNTTLEFNKTVFEHIKNLFSNRGRRTDKISKNQAMLPITAEIIPNSIGTAAGMKFEHNGKSYYFMPGVPVEMKKMFRDYILEELKELSGQKLISEIIHTTGMSEAEIYNRIHYWTLDRFEIDVSLLPKCPTVDIMLTIRDGSEGAEHIQSAVSEIQNILGDAVYGIGDETLESVIASNLIKRKLSIAVAESCTAGLIGHRLTNVSGSSQYFLQGAICYSNQSKIQMLGVKEETLDEYGAVSAPTALEMAIGIRKLSGSDIGLSMTGIAGPSGGTSQKPVGTVYIGLSINKVDNSFHYLYNRDRLSNKNYFAQMALNQLRLALNRDYQL
jgi:nicotinamide-nucleotide amidase